MDSQDELIISQIVEKSLAAILSGESSVEAVLAKYPEHRQLLRSEIEAALWCTAQRDALAPRPGYVAASRKRLVARIQAEGAPVRKADRRAAPASFWQPRLVFRLLTGLTVFMLLFMSTFGAVSASQGSLPGEPLYTVKRVSENVQYTFTLNPANRMKLNVEFSNRRLDEIELLIAHGQVGLVDEALVDFEYQINQSLVLIESASQSSAGTDTDLLQHVKQDLARHMVQLTYLLDIAPESAQSGLQHALEVSQHGFETANEMRNNPKGTPPGQMRQLTKTPGSSSGGQSEKTKESQPGGNAPGLSDATKTPRPTAETGPDNNPGKPTQAAPSENRGKPTKESGPDPEPTKVPPGQNR